jgi:hypothetical protein
LCSPPDWKSAATQAELHHTLNYYLTIKKNH